MNGQGAATTTQEQTNSQPVEKPFPMDDSSPFDSGDWGIKFDESGHIQITGDTKKADGGSAADTAEQITDPPSQKAPQQSDGNSPADARIAKLEGTVTQLINVVTQMATMGNSNSLNQGEQRQEYDLQDQNQLSRYIGDSINSALKPVLDILPKIVQRIELQDTRTKYGNDFEETYPAIQELMNGDALTFDKVMNFVKTIKGQSNKQSANTHGAIQNEVPKQQGTAEALISKANRVQTQSGINGSVPSTQRPIASVRDAFEAALDSLA